MGMTTISLISKDTHKQGNQWCHEFYTQDQNGNRAPHTPCFATEAESWKSQCSGHQSQTVDPANLPKCQAQLQLMNLDLVTLQEQPSTVVLLI